MGYVIEHSKNLIEVATEPSKPNKMFFKTFAEDSMYSNLNCEECHVRSFRNKTFDCNQNELCKYVNIVLNCELGETWKEVKQ